jgi:hypothetical protein
MRSSIRTAFSLVFRNAGSSTLVRRSKGHSPRRFNIVGQFDATSQGGTSTFGCGIPGFTFNGGKLAPGAAAVVINYVAIGARAPGVLKAWPTDRSIPQTGIVNYGAGVAVANSTITGLRQDTEGSDVSIFASQAVHVSASVVGYIALPGSQNALFDSGGLSVIGGGFQNMVTDNGLSDTIGGGFGNIAGNAFATIPGGWSNIADGQGSLAAGSGAQALHDGAFVLADFESVGGGVSPVPFSSTAINEFSARFTGGARFVSAIDQDGNPAAGVVLAPGGGSWSSVSDRNAKTNFSPADGLEMLEKHASLPVETWSYKAQDPKIRHIGPMAQEFKAAFQVGEDDRYISAVDADGVALAAIQGLHKILKEKDAEIADLKKTVRSLQREQSVFERRLESVEKNTHHGRRADGELRPSGRAHGARPGSLRTLAARSALRPRGSVLADPRPPSASRLRFAVAGDR